MESEELPVSFYAGSGVVDLGWMIHDRLATDPAALQYYRPLMIDGAMDLRSLDHAALAT